MNRGGGEGSRRERGGGRGRRGQSGTGSRGKTGLRTYVHRDERKTGLHEKHGEKHWNQSRVSSDGRHSPWEGGHFDASLDHYPEHSSLDHYPEHSNESDQEEFYDAEDVTCLSADGQSTLDQTKGHSSGSSHTMQGDTNYQSHHRDKRFCGQSKAHGETPISQQRSNISSKQIEVQWFGQSIDEETLTLYFESGRKSGGGEIQDIKVNEGSATITFNERSVVDRILEREHWLNGKQVTVMEATEINQSDHREPRDNEEPVPCEVVLEVCGFRPGTTEDMLGMYFESTRRSGGGEVVEVKVDEAKDKATIKFADDKVIDSVLRKGVLKFEGSVLTLSKKTLGPPRPIDRHRIFLRGLPDGVQEETLMLYIENRTSMADDPDIVYGEEPGTAMLYFEDEITNLELIIERFGKKKLQNVPIKAETVPITNCILVQGLASDTSQDMLELYFENERKSGGDLVADVAFNEGDDRAIVTFEDFSIIHRVLSRRHKLSKNDLTVTAHYECLGTAISTDGPTPVVPKPITQTVDHVKMDFIMSKHHSKLEREMAMYNAEVMWPTDEDKSKATLKPVATESNDPSMWKNWKETSVLNLSAFLQGFSVDSVQVPSMVWGDFAEALPEIAVGDVHVVQINEKSTISLVGVTPDVVKVKEVILKTVDELKLKAERDAQTIERKIKLLPLKMKLFTKLIEMTNELKEKAPEVDVSVLPENNEIVFKGIRADISEAQVAMYGEFEALTKSVFDTEPHIVEYVASFCDTVNQMMEDRNIETLCDVEAGKITIYSKTPSNLERSMEFLRSGIVSNHMTIEREATLKVLQSKKGSDQINSINEGHVVVMRLELAYRAVRVTGSRDSVDAAVAELGQFLDENVVLERKIQLKSLHGEFITQYRGKDLLEIQSQHPDVSVQPVKDGFIVKGNEKGSDSVATKLENLKATIVDRKHHVDKPGIPDLLRDQKGQRTLQNIARNCECVIRSDVKEEIEIEDEGVAISESRSEILCHATVNGCKLVVCKGDMTQENVDAIVNAANQDLKHIGGLAKVIVQNGGHIIQQESSHKRSQLGRKLNVGEVVRTSAGKLPCQHILHVPGPMWPKYRRYDPSTVSHEENILYDAVTNCLREASRLGVRSIAIPAISSGVYGFPIDLCTKTIVEASAEFANARNPSSLCEIKFIDVTVRHSVAFQKALENACGMDVRDGAPGSGRTTRVAPKVTATRPVAGAVVGGAAASATTIDPSSNTSTLFSKHGADTIVTKEGTKITLKKGSLASEKADIIVNTAASDMVLSRGNVSKALLQAAGASIQAECDMQMTQADGTRKELTSGDFMETGPGNLSCKKVIHLTCPGYKDQNSVKVLQAAIQKILTQAAHNGTASIAFPAIGTGNLGFPRDVTARVMYETVAKFSKDNPSSSLKDIRFWVYDKDLPTVQAFETEMQNLTTTTAAGPSSSSEATKSRKSTRKMKKTPSMFSLSIDEPDTGPVAEESASAAASEGFTSSGGKSEIKFGSVKIQLQQGDLVKETTDAIVNTVGKDLSLKGVVSKALVRGGGSVIAEECNKIRNASNPVPLIAMTTAGTLPSKNIIHVNLSGPDKVRSMTKEILQLAEKSNMQSVAFPALGTGNIGGSPARVAPDLLDAIGEFVTKDKPTNLQLVKLVIFQQDMIPIFEEALKSKAGTSSKKPGNLLKRGFKAAVHATGYVTGRKASGPSKDTKASTSGTNPSSDVVKDSITLHIIADQKQKLDEAIRKIEEFITEEFHSEKIQPDGEVVEFTEHVLQNIRRLAATHGVRVVRKPGNKAIVLEGAKVPVMSTKADIHTLFAKIQSEEKKKAEDLLLSKDVQWRYKTDQGIFDDYDHEINSLLEKAYREKKPYIDLDMEEDGKIRIDIAQMVEVDTSGRKVEIHRADLKTETKRGVLPSNWIPMTENLKIVPLVQMCAEYQQVEQTFKAGYPRGTIVKIERIQNKELYTQYAARKESMKTRLGRDTEMIMYHGTSTDTVSKINMRGFNRSFCGKNATAFGQGTYFARDANYSAQDRYSQRDANNQKYLYMCKVLVGDSEIGDSTIIVPHQKPNSPDIYDSTVDNVRNPSIVVIYHDAQAYPEYLITFS